MTTSVTPPTWAPPTAAAPGPSAQSPRRRPRWPWFVAGGAVVALLAGLTVVGLVAMDSTVLRHDLITADFDTSADPFATGSVDQYVATLVGGTYEMRATTAPDGRSTSFGMFTRTAYAVTAAVTVVEVHDPSQDAVVGIACLDLPETNGHGYAFVVSSGDLGIGRADGGEGTILVTEPTGDLWPLDGRRLEITCLPDGDTVTIIGSVDGTEVVTATDTAGFTRYQAAELIFAPYERGDSVRFDDLIARVPAD